MTKLPDYLRSYNPPSYVTNLDRCGREVRDSCRRGDYTDAVQIIRARLKHEGHFVPPVHLDRRPAVEVTLTATISPHLRLPKHRRPGPPDPVPITPRTVLTAGWRHLSNAVRRAAS